MKRRAARVVCGAMVIGAGSCAAQTVTSGSALALKSSGAASGTGWQLTSDGYVGTYIQLSAPAAVTLTANAANTSAAGATAAPDLTFSIANRSFSQSVSSTSGGNYAYTTPVLPAGTYFVRTQLDNSVSGATGAPALTVNSLTVGGAGVSVLNQNTSTNALNAANTYADNFRSGSATVHLVLPNGQSVASGTAAHVQLASNAFNFALAVPGQSPFFQNATWLNYNTSTGQYAAPAAGSTAALYQQRLLQNFNTIVPTNAGKWQNDESTAGSVNMQLVDAMSQFASQNGLGMRMHNLLWYNQQPTFINTDFTNHNTSAITSAVTSRINYYVSQNNPQLGTPRADAYQEMDVLNEPVHGDVQTQNADHYQQMLGTSGVANIYKQVQTAVAAAGASTRLYTNEYNVLQNSANPSTAANDPYANWYLNEVTQLNNTSAGKVVTGVGTELYVYYNGTKGSTATTGSLSPATMMGALQNLAVAGNPISLTEFGESTASPATPTAAAFASDLTTALTMMYGDPQATTFGFWGGLGGSVDANSITSLYDANWNLTAVGAAYQQWMSQWATSLDLTTDANGDLAFTGTYGTYDLTLNGHTYTFTLTPDGPSALTLAVPEPAAGAAVGIAWMMAQGRHRRRRR